MRKSSLIFLFLFLMITPLTLAEEKSIPGATQGECLVLSQTCSNCTYVNITSIKRYPGGVNVQGNVPLTMTKIGTDYNFTFCNTSIIGKYTYTTAGDLNGLILPQTVRFDVTETGESFDLPQSIILIGQFGLIAIFLVIGLTFSKEKWKLKSFFFIMALLMGIILLNSIRIIIGTSSSLSKMGSIGLIVGIVTLSVMVVYLIIMMTIEVFGYFKERRKMRWTDTTRSEAF